MIEPWELILHHNYSGTPGVAFDHSPGHGSHGRIVDLNPSAFALDGVSSGSGAVEFRRKARISVSPTRGWDRLGALAAELVFKSEETPSSGHLVNAMPGHFYIALFGDALEIGVVTNWHTPGSLLGLERFSVSLADHGVDPRSWVRAGITYDGIGTVQFYLNGELVKTSNDRPMQPIRPVAVLTIGNEPSGSLPFDGLIDDIKIWRPNPNRMTGDFTVRIIDAGLTDCWVKWGKAFRAVLDGVTAHDVECAGRLSRLLSAAQAGVAEAAAHNAATRSAWGEAVTDYDRLWSQGNVGDIGPVLQRLLDGLRAAGVDIEQSNAFRALFSDHCLREILSAAPPLDCDPQFVKMLTGEGN